MEFVTSAFSYMYTLCPTFIPLFPFLIMRKVEQQMNEAILNRRIFSKAIQVLKITSQKQALGKQ